MSSGRKRTGSRRSSTDILEPILPSEWKPKPKSSKFSHDNNYRFDPRYGKYVNIHSSRGRKVYQLYYRAKQAVTGPFKLPSQPPSVVPSQPLKKPLSAPQPLKKPLSVHGQNGQNQCSVDHIDPFPPNFGLHVLSPEKLYTRPTSDYDWVFQRNIIRGPSADMKAHLFPFTIRKEAREKHVVRFPWDVDPKEFICRTLFIVDFQNVFLYLLERIDPVRYDRTLKTSGGLQHIFRHIGYQERQRFLYRHIDTIVAIFTSLLPARVKNPLVLVITQGNEISTTVVPVTPSTPKSSAEVVIVECACQSFTGKPTHPTLCHQTHAKNEMDDYMILLILAIRNFYLTESKTRHAESAYAFLFSNDNYRWANPEIFHQPRLYRIHTDMLLPHSPDTTIPA